MEQRSAIDTDKTGIDDLMVLALSLFRSQADAEEAMSAAVAAAARAEKRLQQAQQEPFAAGS